MSIRDTATPKQKAKLCLMRELKATVKDAVYRGAKGPQVTMQFNEDIRLYGMWEALLYVEGYEKKGEYVEGTAMRAFEEAVK